MTLQQRGPNTLRHEGIYDWAKRYRGVPSALLPSLYNVKVAS